jgi:DNA polymerase-3 subunit gamma/tau
MNEDFHVVYRPQSFDEVIGQDHITSSLKKLAQKGKWPHAYLLVGPSGTGKTTVARIIASELKCEPANLIELDAASNSSVEGIRNLTSSLTYKGFGENSTRVIIIDECHSLSKQAWQALLKPIEEPPDHIYFIFCTTEEEKIEKTIKTRCTQFNFRSVTRDNLLDLLLVVAESEKIKLTEKELDLIAQSAEGSPRRALTLLSKSQGAESIEELKEILESTDDNVPLIELSRLLVYGKPTWPKVIKLVNALEDLPPETIRLQIIGYMNTTLLKTTDEVKAVHILNILSALKGFWNPSEKKAPLLLALGEIIFETEDEE